MSDYWTTVELNAKSTLPWKRKKAELLLISRYNRQVLEAINNGAPRPDWPDIKMTREQYDEIERSALAKWIAS